MIATQATNQEDDARRRGETTTREVRPFVPVTDEMLRDPDPGDWLMMNRTYDFQGYSPLDQINRGNVGRLQLAWMRAMDDGAQEIRPLVHDGVMYIAHPGSDHVQALDATTGDLIWDYRLPPPSDLREYAAIGDRTRGLAIYGTNIIHLSADSRLLAIDARTGELAWESVMADYRDGITHTSGAMVVDGKIVTGRACFPGENKEARCFISAHDSDTGTELWRVNTAAGPDELGGDTWGDVPTSKRGHVSPWGLGGSYDPQLGLVYWGIAVPMPYPRIVRRGTWDVGDSTPCELFSNSTVALDVDTGEMEWYYQHLPCDDWDMDFVQERTLIDTVVNPDPEAVMWINPRIAGTAEARKVVVTMGEPGGLFVLDRETGEFLWATPLPYTSTERFVISDIDPATGQVFINMDLVAKELGQQFIICGHNVKGWWSWSYSPLTKLLYIPIKPGLSESDGQRPVAQRGESSIHRPRAGTGGGWRSHGGPRRRHLDRARGLAVQPARAKCWHHAGDRRERGLLRRPRASVPGFRRGNRRGVVGDDHGQSDHRISGDLHGRGQAVPDGAGWWRLDHAACELGARARSAAGEQHARDVRGRSVVPPGLS